jgi:hypothetical protein
MLIYELVRVINLDREREIKRAVLERSLRAALVASQAAIQPHGRRSSDELGRAAELAVSGSR